MNWKMAVSLVLFTGSAFAQNTVSVPCGEFVRVTGKAVVCDAVPFVKLDESDWKAEQDAAARRNDPQANAAPWKRKDPQTATGVSAPARTQDEIAYLCKLPPWKRPDDVKCSPQ
jgi:hypothetical protein